MSNDENKPTSILRILGVGVLGFFVGTLLTGAASKGLELVFPEDDLQFWGLLLWGQHWFLRLVVSLTSTFLGGFVVGIAIPENSKWAATVSALPSSLAFLGGGILALSSLNSIVPLSAGSWFTISAIILLSIPVARFGALWGASWRNENQHLFGKPRRPLGIHWTVFLWLWLPFYLIYADLWYSLYYLIRLSFVDDWKFVLAFGRILIYLAFFCQGYGLLQALWYLIAGQHLGLRPAQVAGRVAIYILILPSVAVGLRAGGFMILSVNENLPSWIYSLIRLFTGA